MAENVKEEMNKKTDCIPAKWSRNTVADGDWLQKNTIAPLSSRDDFLADKLSAASVNLDALSAAIDSVSSISDAKDTFLSGSIDYVSATLDTFSGKVEASAKSLYESITAEQQARYNGDQELKNKIETLQNATDVVDVVGTHAELLSYNKDLTKDDVIKVLVDETKDNLEYYWRIKGSTPVITPPYTEDSWEPVGTITPYYSKSQIESFSANLSSTIANTYLSANGTDISAGKNLDVVIQSNNPRVAFKTKDEVSFSNLTSTNITATAIVAETVNGTNINATTTISTNFSGSALSGETLYTSIDGLIESATNGGAMTGVKNVSGIKLTHIANQSDYEQNPDDGEFAFSTSADQLTFYVSGGAAQWLRPATGQSPYGICLTGISIEDYLYGKELEITANHAYTAGTTLDTFTAINGNTTYVGNISELQLSAGKGITFTSGNDGKLTISSEGTTYTTGQYIDISNVNKISVTGDLIGSAESGQYAYNVLQQSAYITNGPGINFYNANGQLGISAIYETDGTYVTSFDGKQLLAGANYQDGRCISIDENNKINLNDNVSATTFTTVTSNIGGYHGVTSAEMGKLYVSNWSDSYTDTTIINGANISSKNTNGQGNKEILYITPYQVTATKNSNTASCDWLHILSAGNGEFNELTADSISSKTLRLQGVAGQTTHTVDMNGWGFRYGGEGVDYTWWAKVADAAAGEFEPEVSSKIGFKTETINNQVTSYTEITPCNIEMNSQGTGGGSHIEFNLTDLIVNANTLHWSDIFNFISGDGSIKKMVTASRIGSDSNTIYLV